MSKIALRLSASWTTNLHCVLLCAILFSAEKHSKCLALMASSSVVDYSPSPLASPRMMMRSHACYHQRLQHVISGPLRRVQNEEIKTRYRLNRFRISDEGSSCCHRHSSIIRKMTSTDTAEKVKETQTLSNKIYQNEQPISQTQRQEIYGETTSVENMQKVEKLEEGSILGASLLFAGTAIGAGMLALPAETAPAGLVPSLACLVICWLFTCITSLVTLEASWFAVGNADEEKTSKASDNGGSIGFLSIAQASLGPVGEGATAILFWFLLTSILVAYTSGGGELISTIAITKIDSFNPAVGSTTFALSFALLALFGTGYVDIVNRILVAGLVTTFIGLVGTGLPLVLENGTVTGLESSGVPSMLFRADWNAIYPSGLSVGILSFGAQNMAPTLLRYLGNDPVRTRKAVLFGSLLPLVMYGIWELIFFGVVPYDDIGGGNQIISALGEVGGPVIGKVVQAFSFCAIGSSMAGAAVSLVDFFDDAIASRGGDEWCSSGQWRRLMATSLALGPPLILALAVPGAFLGALENAGLIGGVSLYGLIPALAVINQRKSVQSCGTDEAILNKEPSNRIMPGRLQGGTLGLTSIAIISLALVLPEVYRVSSF